MGGAPHMAGGGTRTTPGESSVAGLTQPDAPWGGAIVRTSNRAHPHTSVECSALDAQFSTVLYTMTP